MSLPSSALITRLAPLAPLGDRPDLWAHQANDPIALWQAWEEESGTKQDIPFWAIVWPAARMLARFLHVEPAWVQGRTVLDLGCGGGLASIAAVKAGAARVIANDIDAAARAMTARNAVANHAVVDVEEANLLETDCPVQMQCILVGDLFYEWAAAAALWPWLRTAHHRGVEVLIADAYRPFAPHHGVRLLREEPLATSWAWEGTHTRPVRLLTLA